jgi:Na+/H+ antiporter NhaD/arsenite permease-like protein
LAPPHPNQIRGRVVTREQVQVSFLLGEPRLNLFIVAISMDSVLFGACTYIGNGPNFMVKAIADQQRVNAPGFLGYVFKFTLPYLLPVLLLVWWVFFRG